MIFLSPRPILVKIRSIFVFYFKNAVIYVAIIGIIVRHRLCCHDLHQTERRELKILYVILNLVFVNCKLSLWRDTPKPISLGRQQIHSLTTSTTNVNVYFRICPPERKSCWRSLSSNLSFKCLAREINWKTNSYYQNIWHITERGRYQSFGLYRDVTLDCVQFFGSLGIESIICFASVLNSLDKLLK